MNYADNVKESTTATSAASFTPAGAAPNYRAFTAAYADGTARIPVKVGPDSAGAWELGYYTLSGGVLTRNGVISSSAGGTTAVTFAAGAKDVTVVYPAGYVVDTENAVTMTNKRMTPRVVTVNAPGATPTFNTDLADRIKLTGIAANITSMTTNCTGTPQDGDSLVIDFEGTASYSIAWGTKFEDSTIAAPLGTTGGKKLSVSFDWNTTTSKWRCVGYA